MERLRHTGRQLARSLGLPDVPPPAPLLWRAAGHPKLPSSPALQALASQLARLTASLRWVHPRFPHPAVRPYTLPCRPILLFLLACLRILKLRLHFETA